MDEAGRGLPGALLAPGNLGPQLDDASFVLLQPSLDVARANAAAANAMIQTAAMKPTPSVGGGPGYESGDQGPFTMAFNFSLPIETAGKRGYRIASATHLSLASRIQLAQAAWVVRR